MYLTSIMNFRDFGGIPASGNCIIKEGILFRSATIDNITRVDSLKLHDLNIRTIIDLRAPKEVKKRRRSIDHVAVVSLPLDFQQTTRERIKPYLYKKDSDKILADISNQLYLDILDAAAPVFRQIVELIISDEAVPILIHCQAGKDRTGILAALILLALGTDRQLIVDDFMKSNDELLPYFKKLLLIRKLLTLGYFPAKGMLNIITAKRRNIDSIFGRVQNHYGGIEGYLASAGFDVSRLKDFREKLCSA